MRQVESEKVCCRVVVAVPYDCIELSFKVVIKELNGRDIYCNKIREKNAENSDTLVAGKALEMSGL